MKEKLDSLNNGIISSKQSFKKNIKQYKKLILISYSPIFSFQLWFILFIINIQIYQID